MKTSAIDAQLGPMLLSAFAYVLAYYVILVTKMLVIELTFLMQLANYQVIEDCLKIGTATLYTQP